MRVIGKIIHLHILHGGKHSLDKVKVKARRHRGGKLCIGDMLFNFCGRDGEQTRIRRGIGGFGIPEVVGLGLIPKLKKRDSARKMRRERGYIAFPCRQAFFTEVERHAANARFVGDVFHVKGIAVADIEPYFNAIPDDSETTITYKKDEPVEIVVKPVKFSKDDAE